MFIHLFLFNLFLSCTIAQTFTGGDERSNIPHYRDVPATSFRCEDQLYAGYYSDPEAQCQAFHICVRRHNQLEQFSFLCPNETVFHQQLLVCVWWDTFDCSTAPSLYYINEAIFEDTGHAQLEAHVSRNEFSNELTSSVPEGRSLTTGNIGVSSIGKSLFPEITSTVETKHRKPVEGTSKSRINSSTQKPKVNSPNLKTDSDKSDGQRGNDKPLVNTFATKNEGNDNSKVITTKDETSQLLKAKSRENTWDIAKTDQTLETSPNPTQPLRQKISEPIVKKIDDKRLKVDLTKQFSSGKSLKNIEISKPVNQKQYLNSKSVAPTFTARPSYIPTSPSKTNADPISVNQNVGQFSGLELPQNTFSSNIPSRSQKNNKLKTSDQNARLLSTLQTPPNTFTSNIQAVPQKINAKKLSNQNAKQFTSLRAPDITSVPAKEKSLSTLQTPFRTEKKQVAATPDRSTSRNKSTVSSFKSTAKTFPESKSSFKSIEKLNEIKSTNILNSQFPTLVPSSTPEVQKVGKQISGTGSRRFSKDKSTTQKPFESSTRRPSQSTTRKPFKFSTRRPTESTTRKPFKSATRRPTQSTTQKPIGSPRRRPTQSTTRKRTQTTTSRPRSRPRPRPSKVPANRNLSKGLTAYDILQDFLKNVTIIRSEALLNKGQAKKGNIRRNRRVNPEIGLDFNIQYDKPTPSQLHSIQYDNSNNFNPSSYIPSSSDAEREQQKVQFSRNLTKNKQISLNGNKDNKITTTSSSFYQTQTSEYLPSTKRNFDVSNNSDKAFMKCVYTYGSNQLTGCNFIDPITESFQKLVINEIFSKTDFHVPTPTSQIRKDKTNLYSNDYLSSITSIPSQATSTNGQSFHLPQSGSNSLKIPTEINKIRNIPGQGVPRTIPNVSSPHQDASLPTENFFSTPSFKPFTSSEEEAPVLIVSRADAENNSQNQKKVYVNTIKSPEKSKKKPSILQLPLLTPFTNISPPSQSPLTLNDPKPSSWSDYAQPTEYGSRDQQSTHGQTHLPKDTPSTSYGEVFKESNYPEISFSSSPTPANGLYK